MSITDSERLFELRGGEPLLWLEYAQGFWGSAEVLFERISQVRNIPPSLRRVETNGLFHSIMLLLGLSFENLIKGVYVARHPGLVTRQKLDRSMWIDDSGHGVRKFAESVTTLSSEERGLLDRLQEHIVWAGRYPIPVTATRYHESLHPNHKLRFSARDREVAKGLFARLELELMQARSARSQQSS